VRFRYCSPAAADKLIAAQTRQHIAGAQHAQHQREFTQQGIARGMARRIVDGFEAIEIDKHQRMALARFLNGLQQPFEMVFEADRFARWVRASCEAL
jgi:hypothetical protein